MNLKAFGFLVCATALYMLGRHSINRASGGLTRLDTWRGDCTRDRREHWTGITRKLLHSDQLLPSDPGLQGCNDGVMTTLVGTRLTVDGLQGWVRGGGWTEWVS
jgi:hypothetical protein